MAIEQAIQVLKIEAEGILNLIDQLDDSFVQMAELIYHSKGRLIIGGIGKSGLVGRKIVATLNSTGTRSFFLHPVEAMHGDIGMVSEEDIFLALSNSGETDELNILLPILHEIGCKVIAFTGNPDSTLARQSDLVINVGVEREACPLGLAPTASTTALLAMGDALSVVLIKKRQFSSGDFQKSHPGGTLGRRLQNEVREIMLTGASVPRVYEDNSMADAIREMNRLQLGLTLVLDHNDMLRGIITDGDLRRIIMKSESIFEIPIQTAMTSNPRTLRPDAPVYDALNIMETFQITVLPITSEGGHVEGILHLHDILGKGEFKYNGHVKI